jgi:hypothetical protein
MSNIVNTYSINNHLEVLVCDDEFIVANTESGSVSTRRFGIANTDTGLAAEISESAARAMCINPDSTITTENFEDFCNAAHQFCEDN